MKLFLNHVLKFAGDIESSTCVSICSQRSCGFPLSIILGVYAFSELLAHWRFGENLLISCVQPNFHSVWLRNEPINQRKRSAPPHTAFSRAPLPPQDARSFRRDV